MGEQNDFKIRTVAEKDWPILYQWFRDQGWEIGNSPIMKIALEMEHCNLLVLVDSNDHVVSYLSYIQFKKYVHIGGYITDVKRRGEGIGSTLWKHMINKIGVDTNLYLKSRNPMTEKYQKKSNFDFISPIKCNRYRGKVDAKLIETTITKEQDQDTKITLDCVFGEGVVGQLIRYDTEIHGEDVSNFLKVWFDKCKLDDTSNPLPPIFTVYAKNSNNKIVGYGSIVRCFVGRRIGPLFADNFLIFLLILKRLISHYFLSESEIADDIFVNVPSSNDRVVRFFLDSNFKQAFGSLDRIFTKNVEEPLCEKIYCFTACLGVPE